MTMFSNASGRLSVSLALLLALSACGATTAGRYNYAPPPDFDAPIPRVTAADGSPYRIALAYNVAKRDGSLEMAKALSYDVPMPNRPLQAFASINTDAFRDAGFELVSADAPHDAAVTVFLGENPDSDLQIYQQVMTDDQWVRNLAVNFVSLGLADMKAGSVVDAIYSVEVRTGDSVQMFIRPVRHVHEWDWNRFDLSPAIEEVQAFDDAMSGALEKPIVELMPELQSYLRRAAS